MNEMAAPLGGSTRVFPEKGALFYQPCRRSFDHRATGNRTSMILEKIYWDALDELASALNMPWADVLQALVETAGPDIRSETSYIRGALMQQLLNRQQAHGGATDGRTTHDSGL